MYRESKRAISTVIIAALVIVVLVVAAAGVVLVSYKPSTTTVTSVSTTTATSTLTTSSTTTSTTTSTSPSSQYKLALLVGGDTTDDGLNDQGVQVAQWIQSTYGWSVSISQDVAYSSQGALMTTYAQEGYNVIWADGNQFIGTTEAIAAQFPRVYFIMTPTYDYDNITSNVVALGAQNQATGYYLAGVLAGQVTKTNATGVIIGQWFAELSYEFYAYEAGFHASNPSGTVYLTVPGTWSDPTIGYEDAQTMISTDHVDVIVPIADTTGLGVIAAATVTNTTLIGTVLDQVDLAPTEMMTSVLLNMTAFIQPVIQHIINGTWSQIGGTIENLNLGSLAPFHSFDSLIPTSTKLLLNTTASGIASGTIQVPFNNTQSAPTCPC